MVSLRGIASAAGLEEFSNIRFPHQSPGQRLIFEFERKKNHGRWSQMIIKKIVVHILVRRHSEKRLCGAECFPRWLLADGQHSTAMTNWFFPPYILHQSGEDVKDLSCRLSLNNSRFTSHPNILDHRIAGKTVLPAILDARGDGHLLKDVLGSFNAVFRPRIKLSVGSRLLETS